MLPTRYLYLVDVETNEPLAIFAVDHFDREGEVILYEAQLRARHNVDDPASGLALRHSLLDPLPDAILRAFKSGFAKAYARAQQKRTLH